jgi:hypothetical protein
LLVLGPGMLYTSLTKFPGVSALVPCMGAVLLIATGQVGFTLPGRLLSTKPFIFIGLISYSLYLWHWPLLVFQANYLMLVNRPYYEHRPKLVLLGLSFILATISWWLVETPFRRGRLRPKRARLFLVNGVLVGALACVVSWIILNRGVRSRFPDEVLRVASFGKYDVSANWRKGACFIMPYQNFSEYQTQTCLGVDRGHKNYLLYGDSLAASLYAGLVKTFPEIHFQQATAAACAPYLDVTSSSVPFRANCLAMQRYVNTTYLATQHPDAVILAGGWTESEIPNLRQEIEYLRQKNIPIVLVGPPIRFDMPAPLLLTNIIRRNESREERTKDLSQHMRMDEERLDTVLSQMANEQHVRYVSYYKDVCGHQLEELAKTQWETSNGCPLFTKSGDPFLFDYHHPTESGAEQLLSAARRLGQLP